VGEMEAFAAALRRLRVERGMSLRGLAALAPLDVGYLSKIENGHRKVTLSVARAVDAALDAKGELVALARIERAARVRQAIPFDPMRRRTLLKWGLTAPALIEPPNEVSDTPRLGKIGVADAVELNDSAVWLYNLDHQHGGATLWHAAAACASSGYNMLEHGTYSDVVERRLLKATGRMQMCAGWLAFDAGRQDMARSCYTEALALARQAGDSEVETHALANLAFQSNLLGRPREAARFTEGAVRAAASPHGKARLTAIPQLRRAIASALSSDHTSQDKAITAARKVIDHEGDKPAEEWCAFLGPAELDGVEGTCLIELGKPRRAESLLQRAITGYADHYARNRALYRVRLARARLDMRTADGAAEAANEALDELTSQVSSWRLRSELNAVADRLAAHTHLPQVALFLHRYAESSRRS
jgi:transcriptional regulator with XRE-family HTH domain